MRLRTIVPGVTLAALAFAAVPASAQTTPLARLSCNSGNYPDCGGWRPINTNAYFSRRLVTGAGPQGQDVVEFTQTPSSTHAQYYLGWFGPSLPHPPAGVTRYLRMRIKPIGPINLSGVADIWSDKFVILADGDNPTGRVICHLSDNGVTSDNLTFWCSRNIDGYPNATPRVAITANVWNELQIEFKSASSTSSGNGSLKVWKNTNNYSAPSAQSGLMQLNAINWGNVSVGYYANATLSPSGRMVMQMADMEWDDEFDGTWAAGAAGGGGGQTSTPPAPPTNLRLIAASVGVAPFSAMVTLMVRRRRREHRA